MHAQGTDMLIPNLDLSKKRLWSWCRRVISHRPPLPPVMSCQTLHFSQTEQFPLSEILAKVKKRSVNFCRWLFHGGKCDRLLLSARTKET